MAPELIADLMHWRDSGWVKDPRLKALLRIVTKLAEGPRVSSAGQPRFLGQLEWFVTQFVRTVLLLEVCAWG